MTTRAEALRMCAALAVGAVAATPGPGPTGAAQGSGAVAVPVRDLADVAGAGETPPPAGSVTGTGLVDRRAGVDVERGRPRARPGRICRRQRPDDVTSVTVTSAQAAVLLMANAVGRSMTVLRRGDSSGEVVLLVTEVVGR